MRALVSWWGWLAPIASMLVLIRCGNSMKSDQELGALVFALLCILLLTWAGVRWLSREDRREETRLHNLWTAGRYAELLELYTTMPERKRNAGHHVMVATLQLNLWQLEESRSSFLAALETRNGSTPVIVGQARASLALISALSGRVDETEAFLRELEPAAEVPMRTLTRAVVEARSGRIAEAHAELSSHEASLLQPPLGSLGRALHTWCETRLTGGAGRVDRVALFGAASPDALRRAWPEFAEFAARDP